jgi:hypothetical protein
MTKTARGWQRIGIVLSVIWFLGFGVYQLAQPTLELELFGQRLHDCATTYEESLDRGECVIPEYVKRIWTKLDATPMFFRSDMGKLNVLRPRSARSAERRDAS